MRAVKLNKDNIVVGVRKTAETLHENEIASETGEIGQKRLEDGTFIDVEQPIEDSPPSIEEQILFENKYQTMLLEMVTF